MKTNIKDSLHAIRTVKDIPDGLLEHELKNRQGSKRKAANGLIEESCKIGEIAATIRQNPRTVARWTKQTRVRQKKERNDKVRSLRDRGWTLTKIAEELGIGYPTVWRVVNTNDPKTP